MKIEVKSVKGSDFVTLQELVNAYARPQRYSGGCSGSDFTVTEVSLEGAYALGTSRFEDCYGNISLFISSVKEPEFRKLLKVFNSEKNYKAEERFLKCSWGDNKSFSLPAMVAFQERILHLPALSVQFSASFENNIHDRYPQGEFSKVEMHLTRDMPAKAYDVAVKAVYDFHVSR